MTAFQQCHTQPAGCKGLYKLALKVRKGMVENNGSMRWTDSISMFEWIWWPVPCIASPAVCTIQNFANDSKVGGVIESLQRQDALQGDLDTLEIWDMVNGINFKYWTPHLGWRHAKHMNKLGEECLLQERKWRGRWSSFLPSIQW